MCSIGISENKFLSKMAADMKKPMGITQLWQDSIKEKLWPLPVASMYGIGKQTAKRLANIGIETIGQLANFDQLILADRFGKHGIEMHRRANGIDTDPLIPRREDDIKSIGKSTTLSEDIVDLVRAKRVILSLADQIGITARKYNKKGRTVQITIKYSDFKVITRQKSVKATNLTKHIYQAGKELLEQVWDTALAVRLLGITITGFDEEKDQISMFEQLDSYLDNREEKLEKTADKLRNKHGMSILKPASLLKNEDKSH
jgi:DNA polymerase-4